MSLYRVDFTTWENDGDNYEYLSVYLTTEADVNFYKDLANVFVDKYNNGGMGNDYCRFKVINEVVEDLMAEHPDISQYLKDDWKKVIAEPGEAYNKLCDDILSEPVDYNHGFCRVVEKITVNKINAGSWIKVNDTKAVFKDLEDKKIVYIYSEYERNDDGTPNIFKLEWKTQLCDVKDFRVVSDPDEVSQQVIKLIK